MRADDARGVPAWSFGEGNDDDDWQDGLERNDVDEAPSGRRARVRGGGRRARGTPDEGDGAQASARGCGTLGLM